MEAPFWCAWDSPLILAKSVCMVCAFSKMSSKNIEDPILGFIVKRVKAFSGKVI